MADQHAALVVIGSGPGGYTAAFRAADLGLDVILIERYATLGGVCLNVGCIPSKALLHAAKVIDEAEHMSDCGITFGKPEIDATKVRQWKDGVIGKLTAGLAMMAKQRKVKVIQGSAVFSGANEVTVAHEGQQQTVSFDNAIIAVGSRVVDLPFIPQDPRIIDSTGALQLNQVNGSLAVLGGGIIGMEMSQVYHALGADITVVEMAAQLMPGADPDIVKPLHKLLSKKYDNIYLQTKATRVEAKDDGIWLTLEGDKAPQEPQRFDQLLVAVGRRPNGDQIAAQAAGVAVDERGFIAVDKQMRTNVPHIFAIGDVVGNPMLAHKAIPEGRIAAEVIAGKKHFFDAKTIPSVAYTDPEVAWAGMSEQEAKAAGINVSVGKFPWMASGRALSLDRPEGMTKLIFDKDNDRLLGGAICGPGAGDLISEVVLAIEMGCEAEDIALTIHPHPTLPETIVGAVEVYLGSVTDLYIPPKK